MLLHKDTYFMDKGELGALARIASVDESRASLVGVWFDPGQEGDGRIWATDGHRAAIVDRDGTSKPTAPRGLLAVDLLRVAKQCRVRDLIAIRPGAANGKRARRPNFSVFAGHGRKSVDLIEAARRGELTDDVAVSSGNVGLVDASPAAIDQVFPATDRSVKDVTGQVAFNPALLAPFLTDASRIVGDVRSVKVYFAGQLDPMVYVLEDHDRDTTWRYVLMPTRN